MDHLNVNTPDLLRAGHAYQDLAARAERVLTTAAAEVQRIAATHGPMGYPTAVGIAAGLAARETPIRSMVTDFASYTTRFNEHAATYTEQDHRAAQRLLSIEWPTDLPTANVRPKSNDLPTCYIGTEGGDVAKLCPPGTVTVSYVDKDGNYVFKNLQSGEVTIRLRPGPVDGDPKTCWLPSADASRSVCGPGTTSWMYPSRGNDTLITEEQGPDQRPHVTFETPRGPLIP